jgi:sporulation protein YlmC with PRC-barrel domain
MKRLLMATCALAAMSGVAMAEGSSSTQQPSAQNATANSTGTSSTAAPSNTTQSSTSNQKGDKSPTAAQSDTSQGSKSISQSSTTNQAGTTSPTAAQSNTAAQPGVRRVEAGALVLSFYTAMPADLRASKLIGEEVYNLDNENIGEVSDLIIDNGKTIKAVVVSVGGFLGLGERNVAIKPGSVVLSEMPDGTARLVVNTTKEQLKNAPPFDFAEVDKAGPDAGKTTTGSASGSQTTGGTSSTDK